MTTVAQALAAVMNDVREVRKKERNQAQNFNFRGVDAVMNAVGPAFREHGVVCIPRLVKHEIKSKDRGQGKWVNFATVEVEYTFYGPEGDSIPAGSAPGEATDYGDKGTAKAMSVAYRTFLLQALCLPTDDPDPDHDTYQESRPQTQQAPPAPAGPDWKAQYAAAQSKGPETFGNFLKWAEQHDGPADMIAAGRTWLAENAPVEGEVVQ